jgi:hypothetical protein
MAKPLTRLVVILTLAATAWFLLSRAGWMPGLRDIFSPRAVKIDETPVLVSEIRQLAEWTTVVSYDEVVEDTIRTESDPNPIAVLKGTDRLVIIAKGSVRAGTDLSSMDPDAIRRIGDSISVVLPSARILDATVNPSGVETFIESGSWPGEAFERLKIKARERMMDRALQQGILGKADRRAVTLMENLLRQAGFEKTSVSIR